MDDAVILATNRTMCIKKLEVLSKYCNEYGMIINESKTKFFVVNGHAIDREDLKVNSIAVSYTHRYLYLGAWFTDSGRIKDIVSVHETSNEAVVSKFVIFCAANSEMPYAYKRRVFDAAVISSLLYSCESWLTKNIKGIEGQDNKLMKCLLGVRKNTSNNLCTLEAGILPVKNIIANKQRSFLISKLENMNEELPFNYVYSMCRDNGTPGYRYLSNVIQQNYQHNTLEVIAHGVREGSRNATKLTTYVSDFNPSLCVHKVYSTTQYIPDFCRVSFTRLRLMSHNLRVETGRWSRTPAHLRTCSCDNDSVQSESHVLVLCPLSNHCRTRYSMLNFENVNTLMNEPTHIVELCKYIHDVLSLY